MSSLSFAALHPCFRWHHCDPAHLGRAALHQGQQRCQEPAHLHHFLCVGPVHAAADHPRHQVGFLTVSHVVGRLHRDITGPEKLLCSHLVNPSWCFHSSPEIYHRSFTITWRFTDTSHHISSDISNMTRAIKMSDSQDIDRIIKTQITHTWLFWVLYWMLHMKHYIIKRWGETPLNSFFISLPLKWQKKKQTCPQCTCSTYFASLK